MLSDSNGRMMVNDLCSSYLCQPDDWGKGTFLYEQPCRVCALQGNKKSMGGLLQKIRPTIAATSLCTTARADRLGFLMVYGADAHGPYLHNISNSLNDPRVDSSVRFCAGVAEFSTRVRIPDAISLGSVAWDLSSEWFRQPRRNASEWKVRGNFRPSAAALATYAANLRARVRELVACKSPATRIYLQTARSQGQRAFLLYNDVIRRVAANGSELGLSGVLDFDRTLESGYFDPSSSDRNCDAWCRRRVRNDDDTHVNAWHSAKFARFAMETVRNAGSRPGSYS